jgi:hypothetical protein
MSVWLVEVYKLLTAANLPWDSSLLMRRRHSADRTGCSIRRGHRPGLVSRCCLLDGRWISPASGTWLHRIHSSGCMLDQCQAQWTTAYATYAHALTLNRTCSWMAWRICADIFDEFALERLLDIVPYLTITATAPHAQSIPFCITCQRVLLLISRAVVPVATCCNIVHVQVPRHHLRSFLNLRE